MKRVILTWNLGKGSKQLRNLLVAGRTFAILSIGSMILVIVIGVGAIMQSRTAKSPVSSMKGFAAAVSSGVFADMLAMEIPGASQGEHSSALSSRQMSSFLVRLLTDVNPSDPKSLLAAEYPGLGGDNAILLRGGSAADVTVEPEDHEPIPDDGQPVESGRPDLGPDGGPASEPGNSGQTDPGANGAPGTGGSADNGQTGKEDSSQPTTGGRNVVFIYHSHSRESWFPEIKNSKTPESSTTNITLLGKRLANKLIDKGIGSLHSGTDYATSVKQYNWALSYKYSKKTVTEAMSVNKELKFFFDIHRDSLHRKNTTTTIGGQAYAQVFFIIGHANPDWRQNEAFANQIHEMLEKQYPGISRGIWGKTTANGNGEYNQSVSPESVLIEVGGVDNTLEESYRTIDALAKVIAQIYWNAEKVNINKAEGL
ncbi:stage II sporulation protein P [Paenibacillus nasutitermitis]|uniref:Stage II sporulation protein P n=1 Tax=Paenibacillus nasutitermitis TaxID=1652958 RepID=A0A916Z188_9BACL|nr:stage II sporulation protein P [Paenibacillus nasutitermitis]GGD71694.1 stage II sporulation protein P [Paenibacillus nasutitermitis]